MLALSGFDGRSSQFANVTLPTRNYSEVDINRNGQVELNEYLELMYGLKTGNIVNSRLATAIKSQHNYEEEEEYRRITVERSGGGL